jgi:hypothetical protein
MPRASVTSLDRFAVGLLMAASPEPGIRRLDHVGRQRGDLLFGREWDDLHQSPRR